MSSLYRLRRFCYACLTTPLFRTRLHSLPFSQSLFFCLSSSISSISSTYSNILVAYQINDVSVRFPYVHLRKVFSNPPLAVPLIHRAVLEIGAVHRLLTHHNTSSCVLLAEASPGISATCVLLHRLTISQTLLSTRWHIFLQILGRGFTRYFRSLCPTASLDHQPDSQKYHHRAQPNSHRTASSFCKNAQVHFSASEAGMSGHKFHRPASLTNTQVAAKCGVEDWVYWTKDRNDKGEPTGRLRYVSEAIYHPPTSGAHYADDKWTYSIKDGPGEKAQYLGEAEEGDLQFDNPNGIPNLIDDSP